MTINSEEYVHDYANRMAPLSQRQMPVYSQVGKGLRGDSASIVFNEDGSDSSLQGKYFNQMTGQTEDLWEMPLMDLVPKMHYETWKCVREIDGVMMWGFYIKFSCDITMNGDTVTFWTMDTPIVYTHPFNGGSVPADYMIDSDN